MIPFPAGHFGAPRRAWGLTDKTANITLSAAATTASAATNATYGEAARGAVFHSTGKRYCEITLGSACVAGASGLAGLATQSAVLAGNTALASMIGRISGFSYQWCQGGIAMLNNGAIMGVHSNNTQLAYSGLGYSSSGNTIAIAADISAGLCWIRNLSKTGQTGQWNLNLNGDPAAGTGGATMPAGAVAPFIGVIYGNTGTLGTLNVGASAFTGTVPGGFSGRWM